MDKILSSAKSANNAAGESATQGAPSTTTPLPNGVVLGKDGKPCRTCTDTAAWRALIRSKKGNAPGNTGNSTTSSTTAMAAMMGAAAGTSAATTTSSAAPTQTSDCPPDVQELGRSTWTLLHSIAASYPKTAPPQQQSEMAQFLSLFSRLYPCWVCAEDFQAWMAKEKPVLNGRQDLGQWMCRAHNEVNKKLGKAEFDCRFWEERWRKGWADGRCD